MRVLVTGASGFVGRALCPLLVARGHEVIALARAGAVLPAGVSRRVPADLERLDALDLDALGVDAVVHLAARVHVMHPDADEAARQQRINCDATLQLAELAQRAGVGRFIYLSSIKVNGEASGAEPFRADDSAAPADPYARSKHQAEQGLRRLVAASAMELVIIRAPLVYGPGVKANFAQLVRWVRRGVPLPLAALDNRRSLVSVANLCDLLVCCLDHPAAANQTFLVSDGEAISTPELVRRIAVAGGYPARLLPLPPAWLRLLGRLSGKRAAVERLLGSLEIDIDKTRQRLQWRPPVTMQQTLAACINEIE